MFPIAEATKAGIAVGRYGDAINIAYPESNTRRGRVGKNSPVVAYRVFPGGYM